MKIFKITLSVATLVVLNFSNTSANETLQKDNISQDHTFEKGYVEGKGYHLGYNWLLTGDLRSGWLEYDYSNPPGAENDHNINRGHTNSRGFYVIPKLSITSPEWAGISGKLTGAAATDFGINDPKYESRNFVFDANDLESYMIVQELYLQYNQNGNRALIGREELTTPMIDADDWYMLANSFELAYYENSMLEHSTFNLGYFHKMAGVWDSGANGTEFHSMSDASFVSQQDKDNADDAGVLFGSYQYSDTTHNIQLWEYYATDLYNMLFAQYDYKGTTDSFSYTLGAQFINWKEIGKLADNKARTNHIDYSLYSVRFDGAFNNGISFATGAAKYSDGEGQGETLGAWGGYPYFANGMIFHFFEAGTLQNAASYKTQLAYDIMDGLGISARYTFWDLDASKSTTVAGAPQDSMSMYGVRLSYNGTNSTYFTGTYEYVDLDNEPGISSLRLIGGIKF
ncbi:MAG: hypothetical protein U9P71_08040 [Campylobacterota bacterium]|nr:hypothetical protein [Campylobacterota bacterium]